ncbi:retrovirus-related Pol polyprotein from transposon 297 [Penaeus vannamei]|uniref:retrovirus-related Pol polyprotein from transposon 297 n=1 Tax=Penaeus vannamei TaxID=6689 RepID=UPI00387F59DC
MDKDSRPLTTFSTPQGHFQFKSMPFGFRNSPMTFSHLMSIIMAGMIGNTVFLYLDDLLVVSKNTQEHESKLRKIFQRLTDAGLTINPKKCTFFQKKINYLGHTVDSNGISPNSAKIEDILRFLTPREVKHVKSFLGLAGFYRPFIKGFAKIADLQS